MKQKKRIDKSYMRYSNKRIKKRKFLKRTAYKGKGKGRSARKQYF